MAKITDLAIRKGISRLQSGETNRVELKEGTERGAGRLTLILRKTSSGHSAEWFAVWSRDGDRKSTKFGTYPDITVAKARAIYREMYAPAILRGENPTGTRAWTRKKDGTLQLMAEAYLKDMEVRGKAPGSIRTAHYCLIGPSGIVTKLGPQRQAKDVTAHEIADQLREVRTRGKAYHANNQKAFLRSAFECALTSRYAYHSEAGGIDWGITINPVKLIPVDPAAFKPGERYLTEDEFRAFWHWLTRKGESFRYRFAPAIQLMMATGQRVSEIMQLGPAHFDEYERTLSWRKTKNGRPHCIPLPGAALDIVNSLQASDHGHFFARQRVSTKPALDNATKWLIGRYCIETGAKRFAARDLRRTWKTLAGAAGVSKELRDRIQNHAISDVSSKHYDRYDYLDEKRGAMDQWQSHLAKILVGDQDGVVDFARPVRITKAKPSSNTRPSQVSSGSRNAMEPDSWTSCPQGAVRYLSRGRAGHVAQQ